MRVVASSLDLGTPRPSSGPAGHPLPGGEGIVATVHGSSPLPDDSTPLLYGSGRRGGGIPTRPMTAIGFVRAGIGTAAYSSRSTCTQSKAAACKCRKICGCHGFRTRTPCTRGWAGTGSEYGTRGTPVDCSDSRLTVHVIGSPGWAGRFDRLLCWDRRHDTSDLGRAERRDWVRSRRGCRPRVNLKPFWKRCLRRRRGLGSFAPKSQLSAVGRPRKLLRRTRRVRRTPPIPSSRIGFVRAVSRPLRGPQRPPAIGSVRALLASCGRSGGTGSYSTPWMLAVACVHGVGKPNPCHPPIFAWCGRRVSLSSKLRKSAVKATTHFKSNSCPPFIDDRSLNST